jgi:hypothetical protein
MTQSTADIIERTDIHQHTKAVCVLLDALNETEKLAGHIREIGSGLSFANADRIIVLTQQARRDTEKLNT